MRLRAQSTPSVIRPFLSCQLQAVASGGQGDPLERVGINYILLRLGESRLKAGKAGSYWSLWVASAEVRVAIGVGVTGTEGGCGWRVGWCTAEDCAC